MKKIKIKAKSRRVVSKRFKVTKTGKVKRKACGTSHLNRKNDSSTKSRKKRDETVKGKFIKKVKKMIKG